MIKKQTTLDLNGPILSFVTQPSSVFICTAGIATFVGVATATFPTQSPGSNTGYISYNWYLDGYGKLSDGNIGNMTIVGSSSTTLTVSNLKNPNDIDQSKFFLRSDYVASAYSVSGYDVDYLSGTARFTGNATNDPKDSDIATLNLYPDIIITSNPGITTVGQDVSAVFSVEATTSKISQSSISYQWQINGVDLTDGTNVLLLSQLINPDSPGTLTNTPNSVTFEVSGSKTSILTITSSTVNSYTIRCKLTHPNACNSPLYSNAVTYNVVEPRAILGIEGYTSGVSTATLVQKELQYDTPFTIDSSNVNDDTICLYSKEKDILVEMEIYGASGSNSSNGFLGGQGGYSKIRFEMRKNEEYILLGIKQNSAIFLYNKAKLIACVGQGGNGGFAGNGGRGGGIGLSGENGFGNNSGLGGSVILNGQLTGSGIFGSSSSTTLIYSEDRKASGNSGGRTLTCSKGVYWRNQGRSACQDLGTIKYRLSNGTEVSNSASIFRGFKDGYSINQTAGLNTQSTTAGGLGGNGATGGNGGVSGGGGGGSGYTDGSVTILNSILGGSTANSKVIITSVKPFGDFYVDSFGRILIFSAATPGKDPATLTKTTGKVLPGTDTCIDDARWQTFLTLADTQDYRITATLDNSTTQITGATSFNIRKMKNANYIRLKNSLTDWELVPYPYTLKCLAWDEDSIGPGYGSDYSIFSWGGTSYYYGYYGLSSNTFFSPTTYGNVTANFWILPPGVPDFS